MNKLELEKQMEEFETFKKIVKINSSVFKVAISFITVSIWVIFNVVIAAINVLIKKGIPLKYFFHTFYYIYFYDIYGTNFIFSIITKVACVLFVVSVCLFIHFKINKLNYYQNLYSQYVSKKEIIQEPVLELLGKGTSIFCTYSYEEIDEQALKKNNNTQKISSYLQNKKSVQVTFEKMHSKKYVFKEEANGSHYIYFFLSENNKKNRIKNVDCKG